MVIIQKKNFNIDREIEKIKSAYSEIGAVSTFIGYVRNTNKERVVKSINLEVYKKMAVSHLKKICEDAIKKWSLIDCLVIHRYGHLKVNEKIVLVATFSKNRKNSFESCNYIMNYLKKEAPIWKKEFYNKENEWLVNVVN